MKTFKFSILETWIGGIKPARIIEVKAKTESSALKKIRQIQGNRDWEVLIMREKNDCGPIAAAPELLEACWTALTALEMNHHLVTNELERATSVQAQSILQKAIAKARGES